MAQAAIYCRSSKDRAEMGLAAQRAELESFAQSKGLAIAAEFSDMEISGSLDEASRPGLRQMLAALADPARQWQTVLAIDTSRIARDTTIALFVTRECDKHGVTIQYAKMPVDGSNAFGEAVLAILRAFDRLHARWSADKGRAGLVANLAAGFRAGGRAPFGYQLKHEETGGVRAGVAVKKSTLVVDPGPAEQVRAFLQARAAGLPRNEAAARAGLDGKAVASLIAIERGALTYAGYTTWNQRRKVKPTREDPRRTMEWRPRSEWVISDKPTHEAIITRAVAEQVLIRHGEFPTRAPRVREPGRFILSGLLFTPEGAQWHGDADSNAYRAGAKGKRVNAAFVEGEVLYRVAADFADRVFLQRTVAEARRMADGIETDTQAIDADLKRAEKRLSNFLAVAGDSGSPSLLGKIYEMEATLASLREQKAEAAERKALKEKLLAINEDDLRRALAATALAMRGDDPLVLEMIGYKDRERIAPEALRRILTALVERVDLDPKTREFTIRYRLPVPIRPKELTGVKMASPRGFEPLFAP